MKASPETDSVPMLRMEFTGQSVDAPLLSETARRFNVNNNIISRADGLRGRCEVRHYANGMHGTQEETQAAIAWLQDHHGESRGTGYV
ncbi:ABC transporter ATP-binding protein [Salmonella enterica subsp. enterica]|nr:ABC transporter ATP-binding protein [Salmonella enterica subsp. enterica]